MNATKNTRMKTEYTPTDNLEQRDKDLAAMLWTVMPESPDPSILEDSESHQDPHPTVAEEIEILIRIEEYMESSFDGKISSFDWKAVDSALDSEILEIRDIASRIFGQLAEY